MSLDKQSMEMPLVAAMLNYQNENVYPRRGIFCADF